MGVNTFITQGAWDCGAINFSATYPTIGPIFLSRMKHIGFHIHLVIETLSHREGGNECTDVCFFAYANQVVDISKSASKHMLDWLYPIPTLCPVDIAENISM
jgi:hypothetical protein